MHYRLRFTQKYNTGALQNNYILSIKVLLTVIFFSNIHLLHRFLS